MATATYTTLATAATATATPPTFNPLMQSTGAVLNLVACCGLGITACKAKVLDQQAISALSRLVYNVFQPSLLFTNVLQTLATPSQSHTTLLLLPLAAALQILVASILSALVLRIVGLNPQSEAGREARICSTFANSGPLPLLFVDALFKQHPDPTMRPRAVAFISFYLLSWSPLFWNYGYCIVIGKEKEKGKEEKDETTMATLEIQQLLNKKGDGDHHHGHASLPPLLAPPTMHGVSGSGSMMEEGGTTPGQATGAATAAKAYPSSLSSPQQCAGFIWVVIKQVATSNAVKKLINPPTLGCALGALVGSVPPLRRLFLEEGAPLSSVFDALRTMGSAYVPCVLLVLAGSLAQGPEGFDRTVLRRAALVMSQRFILMPLFALAMVETGKKLGILPTNDPLFIFILLLQGCMPSAQNSVLILQLEKRPQAAASMARLISIIYVLSIIPIGLLLQALLSICPLF